jgi:acetyl esterase/lipase
MGHSAGAYIAALLALDRSYLSRYGMDAPPPAALIGLAGPYSFDPTTWPTTKKIFTRAAGSPDAARPVAFARAGAPPALLLHGLDDETVELYNTRDLAAALKKAGNEAQTIEYPGIGHVGLVLAISTPFRWRAPALDNMVDFIDRHGGGQLEGGACNGNASH